MRAIKTLKTAFWAAFGVGSVLLYIIFICIGVGVVAKLIAKSIGFGWAIL